MGSHPAVLELFARSLSLRCFSCVRATVSTVLECPASTQRPRDVHICLSLMSRHPNCTASGIESCLSSVEWLPPRAVDPNSEESPRSCLCAMCCLRRSRNPDNPTVMALSTPVHIPLPAHRSQITVTESGCGIFAAIACDLVVFTSGPALAYVGAQWSHVAVGVQLQHELRLLVAVCSSPRPILGSP